MINMVWILPFFIFVLGLGMISMWISIRNSMNSKLEKIRNRILSQSDWISHNSPQVTVEQKHLVEGSIERIYWHYGYMVALRDILKLFNIERI